MKPGILLAALLLFPLFVFSQTRIYVNISAAGANNGLNWADAFTSLKEGLSVAGPGDSVWVAQGTYKPAAGAQRDSSFQLKSGVRLYGGFAGTEAQLAERDWQAHPTVLSGDIGVEGDSADNSYTILYMESPDSGTVVDGLIFRYGIAVPPTLSGSLFSPRQCGGAIYIMAFDEFAYPVIRNCRFEHNRAAIHGGAVCINGGGDGSVAPQFLDCVFEDNSAGVNGGAVYRRGSSWVERIPDFGGCVFRGNRAAERGGGLYFNDAERTDTMHVWACRFLQNTAGYTGGGANFNVGREEGSSLSIKGCLFRENTAVWSGAPYAITSFFFLYTRQVTVDSSFFIENMGGAALVHDDVMGGKLEITNSVYLNNYCNRLLTFGGNFDETAMSGCLSQNNNLFRLLDIAIPKMKITNNIFAEPQIKDILLQINYIEKTDISNNLFLAPECDRFIYAYGLDDTLNLPNNLIQTKKLIEYFDKAQINFYNSLIIKTGPLEGFIDQTCHDCVTTFENCLLDTVYLCDSLPYVVCGPGNLFGLDPMFRDTAAGDYSLLPCSPLIDAGNNAYAAGISTDLSGAPRIQGGTVDIGAYESPAFGLAAQPSVKAACDNLANGAISVPLLGACEPLAVSWLSAGQPGAGLDSLAAGAYAVTLTDAKGQSIVFNAAVPAAASPTLQVDGQPVSCFGAADALLAVMPLSGAAPFSYLWSPSGATDSVLAGLGPGPVSVTATDALGCTATFSFDIPQPDTLQFAATVQDASTSQSADGSILVNMVQGGTPPYDYLWSPGGSTADMLSSLLPGFYTLTVSDDRGCEAVWTFEVKTLIGTWEWEGQALLLLYPNPAGATTTLAGDLGSSGPAVLEIFDAAGRRVQSGVLPDPGAGVWQVSLEGLAPGVYLVCLRDKTGRALGVGRMIKQ